MSEENWIALLGVKGGPAIRPGSNMPTSMLVRIGGRTILVDAGLGAARAVCAQGVALTALDAVIVTHMHSDHYLELGPLFHTAWTAGLSRKVPVIGPSGLAAYWEHFCKAMEFDIRLRIEDEGRCELAPLFDFRAIRQGENRLIEGISLAAMRNDHPPIAESYALRLEAGGKRLVLSGDTAFMEEMAGFARDCDLLVHEAMLAQGVDAVVAKTPNGDERLRKHLMRSHTLAQDAGRVAANAGVKALALNHFVPDGIAPFTEADWESAVRETWNGPLHLGRDGMRIAF
jgi:ribonuclease BN (tRNA processing enzyme)